MGESTVVAIFTAFRCTKVSAYTIILLVAHSERVERGRFVLGGGQAFAGRQLNWHDVISNIVFHPSITRNGT